MGEPSDEQIIADALLLGAVIRPYNLHPDWYVVERPGQVDLLCISAVEAAQTFLSRAGYIYRDGVLAKLR